MLKQSVIHRLLILVIILYSHYHTAAPLPFNKDNYSNSKWSKRSQFRPESPTAVNGNNNGLTSHIKASLLNTDLFITFNNNLKKFPVNNSNLDTLLDRISADLTAHCLSIQKNLNSRVTFTSQFTEKLTETKFVNDHCYSRVASLDLSNNALRQFPAQLTANWFERLKSLNLSNNMIANVSSTGHLATAACRSSIEELDLSANQLVAIEDELFKPLSVLRALNLAGNRIRTISLFAFSTNAHNLIRLDLSQNAIGDMEFLTFSSLVNLKYLNLNGNELQALPSHLLYNLYALEELHVSGNRLKSFNLFT
jgi:Leucine-rich repeat (LRR) protein